jgi:hypothetical protein
LIREELADVKKIHAARKCGIDFPKKNMERWLIGLLSRLGDGTIFKSSVSVIWTQKPNYEHKGTEHVHAIFLPARLISLSLIYSIVLFRMENSLCFVFPSFTV